MCKHRKGQHANRQTKTISNTAIDRQVDRQLPRCMTPIHNYCASSGCDAVLALDSHISGGQRVSPEQVLRVMKQKEGSGSLSVQ